VAGTPGRLHGAKRFLRAVVPLGARKGLARIVGGWSRIPARSWWVQELLRDFAEDDPNSYHRFLWAHHLAYAETYEVGLRFGVENLHPSRRLMFEDLEACLRGLGKDPHSVRSVFEVGASLGYNLRHLEENVFPNADTLEGCDIDAYAIERGGAYLADSGSRVRLGVADMGDLEAVLGDREFDVTLCAGVLMYLRREDAESVVASILEHTSMVAAFAGLADPDQDNRNLADSGVRERDGSFVHDIDGMVARSGGRVARRRWEGARELGGNTLYFVFATPAGA